MSRIAVKGKQNNLIVTLPVEGTTNELMTEVAAYLEQTGSFFENGRVTLDVGERALDQEDLTYLRELLREWSVECDTLSTSNQTTRAA
ncbi:MAG: hypothetical protein ACPGWR_32765, partial [Ardenticatenaceae bacterium]